MCSAKFNGETANPTHCVKRKIECRSHPGECATRVRWIEQVLRIPFSGASNHFIEDELFALVQPKNNAFAMADGSCTCACEGKRDIRAKKKQINKEWSEHAPGNW